MADESFDPDEYVGALLQSSQLPPPQTLGGPNEETRRTWLRRYLPNASWSELSAFDPQNQIEILINRFNGNLLYDIVDWKSEWRQLVRRGLRVTEKLFAANTVELSESAASGVAPKTIFYDFIVRLINEEFENDPEHDTGLRSAFEHNMLTIARDVLWGSYRSDN